MLALPRRHGIDDRHLPLEQALVEVRRCELILHLGDAGQHTHQPGHAAHLLHLYELLAQVREIERALAHLLGDPRRLLRVDRRHRLLDQRDDVAHAEDAVGNARGMEILERIHLLAGADELYRLARHRTHGERGAAAAVAVDPREHDSGQADAIVEGAREVDGVLAGQRVGNEQHLVRIGGALDVGRFRHHRFIEGRAAGGVEDDDVVAAEPSCLQRALRNLRRRLAGDDRQRLDVDLTPEHGELLHGRGTAHVERCHEHFAPRLLGNPLGELGAGGGFAGTLQADHHDRHRRRGIEVNRLAPFAEGVDQLVVHDLHDHLPGRHRFDDLDPDGLALDLVAEGARHIERDVGFEQRAAHLAQRRVDVGLGERAAPRQAIEDAAEPFGERIEHRA